MCARSLPGVSGGERRPWKEEEHKWQNYDGRQLLLPSLENAATNASERDSIKAHESLVDWNGGRRGS